MEATISEFNPQLPPDNPPSFLNYSRGFDADSSMSNLFRGLTGMAEGAIGAVDSAIKGRIRDEATAATDRVRSEYGVDAVEMVQRNINRPGQPVPAALERASHQLDGLTKAMKAGKITPNHYNGRIESITRQIRARYPGYREYIDDTIKNITGIDPANAIIRELFNQAQAGSEVSDYDKLYDWSIKNIGLPENARQKFPTLELLQNYVSHRKRDEAEVEIESKDLALRKSRGDVNKEEVFQTASRRVWRNMSRLMEDETGAITEIKKQIQTLQTTSSAQPLSPDQIQGVRTTMAQVRTKVNAMLTETLFKDFQPGVNYAQFLDKSKLDDLTNQVNTWLTQTEDALVNKNFGLLERNLTLVEATQKSDDAVLMMNENVRLDSAIRRTLGDDALNNMYLKDPKKWDALTETLVNTRLKKMYVPGETSSLDKVFEELKAKGVADPGAYAKTLNKVSSDVADPNLSVEARTELVKNLYGKDNENFLLHITPRDRYDAFLKMANAKTATQLYATKEDGNYNVFKNWVKQSFFAVNYTDLAEANAMIKSRVYQNLKLNHETSLLELTKQNDPDTYNHRFDLTESFLEWGNQNVVDRLNMSLQVVIPLAKLEGIDPNKFVTDILKLGGTELGAPKDESGVDELGYQLSGFLDRNASKEFQEERMQELVDKGGLDILNYIGGLESNGDYNATFGGGKEDLTGMTIEDVYNLQDGMVKSGKESTAVGMYQFKKETLKSAVKALGLDPKTTKFDQAIQDRLALSRLRRRGFDEADLTDPKSRKKFMLELAKEWAALPDPRTGESYYKDVGSNKARVRTEDVENAFDRIYMRARGQRNASSEEER